jgi:hypothetical protein
LPEWRPDLPDWGAYPREKGDHLVPGACPECQAPLLAHVAYDPVTDAYRIGWRAP